MTVAHVKVTIAETEEQGELIIPSELVKEMGMNAGDELTLELVAGTLVIRGESGLARARGAGAPWRRIPPLTIGEEKEAFAWAVAEDNASYE